MQDFSFIRLSTTLDGAKAMQDPLVSNLDYHDTVVVRPDGLYCQITNTLTDISFESDYSVFVVDCNGEELADITSRVGIKEFNHDRNGLNQIGFEILSAGQEFGLEPVFLRFKKIGGDDVWYSTPIVMTANYPRNSTRIDYWGYRYFEGLSYENSQLRQSIELLNLYESGAKDGGEVSGYNQATREENRFREIGARAMLLPKKSFKFNYTDNFVYRRLCVALIHDVIYVNGEKMTSKVILTGGDYMAESNKFELEFELPIDLDDTYSPSLQILQPLTLTDRSPLGLYTQAALPDLITGTFNYPVTLLTGTVKLYGSEGLIATYTQDDITVVANQFFATLPELENGAYYIIVTPDLFTSDNGTFAGVTNSDVWTFEISNGDFSNADFNTNDFFTN